MIGSMLVETRRFPTVAVLCLLIAAGCVLIAILNRQPDWAVFAALPAACGVMILLSQIGRFRAELSEDEMLIHSTGEILPYNRIEMVQFVPTGVTGDCGAIHLITQGKTFVIPHDVGLVPSDLYSFLISQAPPVPPAEVHQSLSDYYHTQLSTFGEDRVWHHAARIPARIHGHLGKFLGPGMLIAVVCWIAAGAYFHRPEWYIFAFLLACFVAPIWASGYRRSKTMSLRDDRAWVFIAILLFPIGLLLFLANRQKREKRIRNACLVIAPVGLALNQAELTGQLRWAELSNVKLKKGSSLRSPMIELLIEGAKIDIQDIYETPLVTIYRQIESYWRAG